MKHSSGSIRARAIGRGFALLAVLTAACHISPVWAHCDALDGPVVRDARTALDGADVTPVLKWVRADDESAIREAFAHTLAVRAQGQEAKDLADMYFFETLVRIHRAGEGEAYTGLKPAGSIDPGIAAADEALHSGVADAIAEEVAAGIAAGIRQRFALVHEREAHAADSIDAGREFVEAYVDYVHFVENAHRLVAEGVSHLHHPEPSAPE